jgi:cell division protein ZapA
MGEQKIAIGGKEFVVACQPGEEELLLAAAQMLDTEAQQIVAQAGRMPEARMLLMAGLMLADRTANAEDQLRLAEGRIAALEAELSAALARPLPEPQRIEVPVIPPQVTDTMAEIAARVEALALQLEERPEDRDAAG